VIGVLALFVSTPSTPSTLPTLAAWPPPARTAPPPPAPAPDAEPVPAGPTTVTLTPARPRLLLGTDGDVAVELDIRGADAVSFQPVRALASVGTLELPRADGAPGHFSARYTPPTERYPQVALLTVELASGARRMHVAARITLEGSTVVPFHTSAGASVTMRIGERNFGPVAADARGRVEIPIVVPPGIRVGVARAVDHAGAARETEVDLQPAAFARVLVLAPATMDVGSFSEIVLLAVEPDGAPVHPTRLALSASAGLLHPLGPGPLGEARFLFEAPRRMGSGAVALTAMAAGTPPSRADTAVALRVGGPAQLVISPSTRKLVVGSGEQARVAISALDAFGNPTAATGVGITVDGQARPLAPAAGGLATLTIEAPGRFDGREGITLDARLGGLRATETIHVTGGPPARLTLAIRDARLVADGHGSTELRVQAVDKNGTPTAVPGLSWDTPDGRVRHVRMPRDGEYIAEYVPDRARERQQQLVAVMASEALRANATLDVTPPPVLLIAAARVGVFYNFGHAAGPAAFLEALRPLAFRGVPLAVGATIGYLSTELTGGGPERIGSTRLEIDQAPVLALARARVPVAVRVDLSGELGAGAMLARTRLTGPLAKDQGFDVTGSAYAPALAAGTDVALTLKPGRLVIGLRYLWCKLGRTSQGDEISGNSAGLIGDIGYRMTF
jgi:hypothetical protein